MKFSIKHFLVFVFFLFPVAAYSQGSGSSEPRKEKKENNFAVTRSVSGTVASASESSVVIKRSSGKTITLRIRNSTKVGSGCLQTDQRVRATYTPKNRNATAISCN